MSNVTITDSESFKVKAKITEITPTAGNAKGFEITVLLKYLSNFWRTLGIQLINYEVNLTLTWSVNCAITNSTGAATFTITDTKLYFPLVTLSTQNNIKLLQQFKSRFKRTMNWNEYQSKVSTQTHNQYLDYLIHPGFPVVKRNFVLSFENIANSI